MQVLRNNVLVDMTPEELATFEVERAEATRVRPEWIKAEARRRIETRYPLHKQSNLTALGGADFLKMRGFIDAVRAACDQHEQSLPANYRDDALWPSLATTPPARTIPAPATPSGAGQPVIQIVESPQAAEDLAAVKEELARMKAFLDTMRAAMPSAT